MTSLHGMTGFFSMVFNIILKATTNLIASFFSLFSRHVCVSVHSCFSVFPGKTPCLVKLLTFTFMEGERMKCEVILQRNEMRGEITKYSRDLITQLVWYSNGWKEVGCQMVWFSNAIWIPDSPTIWILDKWMPSCFFMYWSSIRVGLVHRTHL